MGGTFQAYAASCWDRLARKDALHAVLTTNDEKIFWESGEQEVDALERLDIFPCGARVLDYGCGLGRLTVPLARRSARIVAADVSDEMLGRLRDRLCAVANAKAMKVVPGGEVGGPYDVVVCFLVLQHMPPFLVRRTLRRFARALAPGGRVVIDLPVLEWDPRDFRDLHWPRVPPGELWDSRYYHEDELALLLLDPSGLEIERSVREVRDRPVLVLRRAHLSRSRLMSSESRALSCELRGLAGQFLEMPGLDRGRRFASFGRHFVGTLLHGLWGA